MIIDFIEMAAFSSKAAIFFGYSELVLYLTVLFK